tara:strand:+ start:364 stop:699 length:336 start_codon:yes stop_codon:yes gene_type:complete
MSGIDLSLVLEMINQDPKVFDGLLRKARQESEINPELRKNWNVIARNLLEGDEYNHFLGIENIGDSQDLDKIRLTALYFADQTYRSQFAQKVEQYQSKQSSPDPTPNPQPA